MLYKAQIKQVTDLLRGMSQEDRIAMLACLKLCISTSPVETDANIDDLLFFVRKEVEHGKTHHA